MNYVTVDLNENIQFDRAKFLEVVHYICAKIPVEELGRRRLHRALYLADMLHFTTGGQPLTGEDYQKQPFGPCARHLTWALATLQGSGAIEVKERMYFGFPKEDYVSRRDPDLTRLTAEELRLIDDVMDFVRGRCARELSELKTGEAWEILALGDRIPYYSAFYFYPVGLSDEDLAWGEAEARRIVAERGRQEG
jgi:antitoxin SocA-like protein